MQNITITNGDFNIILGKNKKVDINKFIAWYESLSPSHSFIKDKKKVFQKNSKNIYSATGLKSLTLGEDISWEKIYFMKHFGFLDSLISVLDSKGFNYWEHYLNYIVLLPNIPLANAYDVICYAIENNDFLDVHKEKIRKIFEQTINLVILPKNIEYVEKYLNIFKYIVANKRFDMEWMLIELSKIVDGLPEYKFQFQLKDIFNNQSVLDLDIIEDKVSKQIIPFIKKQNTHSTIIGTGFHFSINTLLFSIKFADNNQPTMSQAQLNYQLNVLSNFINSISDDQKIFWFIDSKFKNNSSFEVNAFPKNSEDLIFLKDIIDVCMNEIYEEKELEIFLNQNYLEKITPISIINKKQAINKF